MTHRFTTALLLALALGGCRRAPALKERGRAASASSPAASTAPPLRGIDDHGSAFSLSDLRGAPAVLIFYRGTFCGICVRRLAAAESHRAAYDALGVRLIGVTPEPADSLGATRHRLHLGFPLVTVSPTSLQRWGVWRPGEPVPRPAEFVIDGRGAVRFEHVGRIASDRASDETLLGVLRSLAAVPGTRQ